MRRSRDEILADMIRETAENPEDGEVKSHVMGSTRMNYYQSEGYLKVLLEAKLLEPVNSEGDIRYRPTERGYQFIKNVDSIKELLKKEE